MPHAIIRGVVLISFYTELAPWNFNFHPEKQQSLSFFNQGYHLKRSTSATQNKESRKLITECLTYAERPIMLNLTAQITHYRSRLAICDADQKVEQANP
jgi:hypothetical protein